MEAWWLHQPQCLLFPPGLVINFHAWTYHPYKHSSHSSGWSGQELMVDQLLMMMMMMIVDLYSALRRAPLLRYVSRCIVKRNVFSADNRKDPMLSDGSRRWSSSRFQTIGPATENAWHPNLLRRWRGTISWQRVADRRCWWLAMYDVGLLSDCWVIILSYSWWQMTTFHMSASPKVSVCCHLLWL